jgi:uncharacterized protein YoxC
MTLDYAIYWAVTLLVPLVILIRVLRDISNTLKEILGEIEDDAQRKDKTAAR